MNILWIQKRKCLKLLICFAIGMIICFYLLSQYISLNFYHFLYHINSIHCYQMKSESLPEISEVTPTKGKSIFFHETSCKSFINGKIWISARQACAVESAAKMNPNLDVYLLYTSPGVFHFKDDESDRILQALMTYDNIRIMHLDYEKYTHGTPVENLYSSGKIENSNWAQSHASDVLRYLTLWKYGGIYLDLDVIVTKTLENLSPNYAGAESERNVAAGILSFAPTGRGHVFANTCLNDLKDHFNGQDWGYNGPGVITRLLKVICGTKLAKDMINKDCQGFTVYPPDRFYAVPWWNWTMYFNEENKEAVINLSNNSYAIHVWNKHSVDTKIPLTSNVPYLYFARKYCPKVVEECDEFF
ncbi:unnamed protein product [Phaedon cochleariae]|uniref:Alpha 1,4-glycosyltransferase domain-containing protein n=1 Tax=Phaedon cochleariae TaxID=80249 RepID=A0A9P0GLU0_PHACE|nr:unnamed protein product [Phaedon cochleariae]